MAGLLRPARVIASVALLFSLVLHVATYLPLPQIDLRRGVVGAMPVILPLALLLARAQSGRNVTIFSLSRHLSTRERIVVSMAFGYIAIDCSYLIATTAYATAVTSAGRVISALAIGFFGMFAVISTLLLRHDLEAATEAIRPQRSPGTVPPATPRGRGSAPPRR